MMISCAPSVVASVSSPSRMAPNTTSWDTMLHSASMLVKQEPSDTMESINQNGTGFLSEGFHSASPASSKESHTHSPRSLDSGGEASPSFYDSIPSHTKLGVNLEHYRGLPYDLLTPPGRDNFTASYSPRRPQPDVADATPPKSPADYCDSGYLNGTVRSADPKSEEGESRDDSNPEDGDFDDEPGLRAPTVNSHGKVKTFKCKQCEFVAVTKLGFWEHTKEHIKPEKMLNCPKCPFVTEYKHHLEYHMRNHFGSKPFQCNQCSYSCVNKSMLNSHLKSHSNIYQYRCADCNYATKYCHSLKLHLRKYQHNPDMVLNQDGTPNPLPIIDVYGTRRGPKQKSSKMEESVQSPNPTSQAPAHPLFQNPFAPTLNFPYGQFLPHHFLFPQNNNYNESKFLPRLPETPLQENTHPFNIEPTMPTHILQHRLLYGGGNMQTAANFEASHVSSTRSETPRCESPKEAPVSPVTPRRSATPPVQTGVLDLTSSKQSEGGSPPPLGNSTPLTPSASMKNRRKGRAFKLQPAALRLQHYNSTEEDDVANTEGTLLISPINETNEISHLTIDAVVPEEHKEKVIPNESEESTKIVDLKNEANSSKRTRDSTDESEAKKVKSIFHCQYCDITFGDVVMYTMHMGYHGYNEPFTCNMCGESSHDKVSFFIHIARSRHS